tara:strand:+ start:2400 stop:2576 length:177 start_codon:yes stop_codon:yes gene_type:complete
MDNKIFTMYLNQVKENKRLRKFVNEHQQSKKKIFNDWNKIEKKLIDGQWWVKSKDALK